MKSEAQEPAIGGNAAGPDAEAKRRAARRRFIARGTAAGSGFLIVTLYHQRGLAAGKKIFTSSAEMCLSLKGTPGKTEPIPNPENPKQKITAFQCNNVPDYKVPWMKK